MTTTIYQSLSEKYDVISPLGCGQNSTVYLIRHKSLDRVLAVKVIPKNLASYQSVLSEARLLRSIDHPGIPMIYDIEEDNQFYFLMEEFVEGESLDQYLLHHSFISKSFYLKSIRELCQIYQYLHSLPQPLLYQDLKPEHIIVGKDQIKLIDFGGLYPLTAAEVEYPIFGNADFSAPEVLNSSAISTQSDVYCIGKMMEYLASYLPTKSEEIQHIFHKATNPSMKDRYETVADLLDALEQEQTCGTHLAKSIAVIGAYAGSGTTHQAIALTSALNKMGVSSYYKEENDSGDLMKLKRYAANLKEQDGYFQYRWFLGYPKYGPGITLSAPPEELAIVDCGTAISIDVLSAAERIILVCGTSPWHIEDILKKAKDLSLFQEKITLLCVGGDAYLARYLKRTLSLTVVLAPYQADPFSVSRESCAITSKLLGMKERFLFTSNLKSIFKRYQEP